MGAYGDLMIVYPKPYSIYFRGTIAESVLKPLGPASILGTIKVLWALLGEDMGRRALVKSSYMFT